MKLAALLAAALLLAACGNPTSSQPAPVPPSSAQSTKPAGAASPLPSPVRAAAPPGLAPVPTLAYAPTGALPNPHTVVVPAPDSCHIRQGDLPDPVCTPGLLNPDVTVPTVAGGKIMVKVPDGRTLDFCSSQFTTTLIRPPESYTSPLKLRLMESYGMRHNPPQPTDLSPAAVELDHLDSIEDIGSPSAVGNLWPMPRGKTLPGSQPTGWKDATAEQKDQIETHAHKLMCADPIHAKDIAAQLSANWHSLELSGGAVGAEAPEPTKEPEP